MFPNSQEPTLLYAHDHTMGITRLSVYAGMHMLYELRDLSNRVAGLPSDQHFLVISDRSFNTDRTLFFAPAPWRPQFYGDFILVNGGPWPKLTVTRSRHRFRIVNVCLDRMLIIATDPPLPIWIIGNWGGFRSVSALNVSSLFMGPGDRFDVIVDFSVLPEDVSSVLLRNSEPPFDANTTGLLMRFDVNGEAVNDTSLTPSQLRLPRIEPLVEPDAKRELHLFAMPNRSAFFLGTNATSPLDYSAALTQDRIEVTSGYVEEWSLYSNLTSIHPIHIHLVMFQVVQRRKLTGGDWEEPDEVERGRFDLVKLLPGTVTVVRALFDGWITDDIPFVVHCHMLSHEDNMMMLPFFIVSPDSASKWIVIMVVVPVTTVAIAAASFVAWRYWRRRQSSYAVLK